MHPISHLTLERLGNKIALVVDNRMAASWDATRLLKKGNFGESVFWGRGTRVFFFNAAVFRIRFADMCL